MVLLLLRQLLLATPHRLRRLFLVAPQCLRHVSLRSCRLSLAQMPKRSPFAVLRPRLLMAALRTRPPMVALQLHSLLAVLQTRPLLVRNSLRGLKVLPPCYVTACPPNMSHLLPSVALLPLRRQSSAALLTLPCLLLAALLCVLRQHLPQLGVL
jgi:hypothetical protein